MNNVETSFEPHLLLTFSYNNNNVEQNIGRCLLDFVRQINEIYK